MEIAFITRTKSEEYEKCSEWLGKFARNKMISNFIIISDLRKSKDEKEGKTIYNCYDINPNSAISLNVAIQKLKGIYSDKSDKRYFIVVSKEVELQNENIDNLVDKIASDKNILVVGYKLRDNILTAEERDIFSNNNGIAYKVPWNTCAIWKYDLFSEYISEFDNICSSNQLGDLALTINKCIEYTKYEGMEDGLAILKALNKKSDLKYILLDDELSWNIAIDEERVKNHKIKMARKNIVLGTFANMKGYSVDNLK